MKYQPCSLRILVVCLFVVCFVLFRTSSGDLKMHWVKLAQVHHCCSWQTNISRRVNDMLLFVCCAMFLLLPLIEKSNKNSWSHKKMLPVLRERMLRQPSGMCCEAFWALSLSILLPMPPSKGHRSNLASLGYDSQWNSNSWCEDTLYTSGRLL